LIALFDQDRSLWDATLVAEGLKLLELSAAGPELTAYHLEAAIASVHATADTNWLKIIALYDQLMLIGPSPVVALNRAIAVAQRDGPERGLEEIAAIAGSERLSAYPLYPAALGELELRRGRDDAARAHFKTARRLARNPMERQYLDRRLNACGRQDDGTGAFYEEFWSHPPAGQLQG
jgi:RNA polymerase sigma-70 factor (ECF subfamily)